IGTAPKATVHTKDTPLHRGFSLFVFNKRKEFLVTQRSFKKKTFPGVWSNTVCGHPAPQERPEKAAIRRLKEELGMTLQSILFVTDYRYRFSDSNGTVENEICPVFIGISDDTPQVNPSEIESYYWIPWENFLQDIQLRPSLYSPWCREEALHVMKSLALMNFLKNE
ncbi:MAG: isopentenyl-diphosphate Delta-isomerase, partial [Patescibacteria group bacterium]|nr:isopentenyl-diphosphate Delta-isomerase [Patescibacteria group bacterium]